MLRALCPCLVAAIVMGCAQSETDQSQVPPGAQSDWHESLEDAQADAKTKQRLILAYFTGKTWCGPCQDFERTVLSKPEFKQWANDNVVLFEVEYPSPDLREAAKEKQDLAVKYSIGGFPTLLLLDAEGVPRSGNLAASGSVTRWIRLAEGEVERARK